MRDSRFARLRAADVINLAAEVPGVPMHMTAVATLDGDTLVDADGHLRMGAIRRTIEHGLAAAPRLRQVLHSPGVLAGPPLWIDRDGFDIRLHVREAALPAPGDEQALLDLAARLMVEPFDRSRPLWRMWFVTGLPDGRVGLVVVLHHVVADGLAGIGLVLALLDRPLCPDTDQPRSPDAEHPRIGAHPSWWALARDHAGTTLGGGRRVVTALRPGTLAGVRGVVRTLTTRSTGPRPASLNRPVGPRRHVGVVRLDLADAKRVAHAHGGTVNDLILGLAAGGLRALLGERGEPVDRLVVRASVAVSLRSAGAPTDAGNQTGAFLVDLPVGAHAAAERLRQVSVRTSAAKAAQPSEGATTFFAALSRVGVARWFSVRQHVVNLVESDLIGPSAPMGLLGAPVRELVPIGSLAGNVPVSVLALSYAGRLVVAVQTDTDAVPDADVLLDAVRRDWDALRRSGAPGAA
ncbi:wax ester/triacylglycerol synthase domain-containing protein [Cryptosporangium minutisporangium]|uniref:diacylglycerol O-acyltransferase n=1 Tax=Cryptosporangium minutisporangium TaxID=113569 RepID=A0ABP6T851_9ACTN